MRENPLGGKAGHANQEVQTRAFLLVDGPNKNKTGAAHAAPVGYDLA
jgi:hypothetical protein